MNSQLTTHRPTHTAASSLLELSWGIFKVGAVAFGGHAALVVMVERYLVTQKKVFNSEDVLNAMSLATLLPGPMAVNVVCYLGYRLGGWLGACVFFAAIAAPPTILMIALAAWYYQSAGQSGAGGSNLFVLLAVAAVVLSTGFTLYKKQIGKDRTGLLLCLGALATTLLYRGFAGSIVLILVGAAVGYLRYRKESVPSVRMPRAPSRSAVNIFIISLLLIILVGYLLGGYRFVPYGPWQVLSVFSGMSLTLFGGGMVIIPYMQSILVDELHWLPVKEYVDAIAFGQITPGPILVSVTFIGYKIAGILGAVLATLAIFIPSASLMIVLAQYINYQQKGIKAVFKGIRPVVIGMILAAGVQLVMVVPHFSWPALLFGLAGLAALSFTRLNPIYLILLGFIIDYIF
ncbi:chromate efflux transporter [Parapedobacter pyrenivorans]|uniref:chromate efflux transporter n=1 Tax=Parapedobacter pyrenivorans TaxID=1305674 RepID=UPI003341D3F3